MKNKTIEILTEGDNFLPKGATITTHIIKPNPELGETSWVTSKDGHKVWVPLDAHHAYEVNFSELPTLYPTKDMVVPEEGIPFVDGDGRLLDVGKNGFSYYCDGEDWQRFILWSDKAEGHKHFQLKRPLPKTITVCAECFKETCECVREEGWYFATCVESGKEGIILWNGRTEMFLLLKTGNALNVKLSEIEIDWNNPINVKPEGE